jgi:hypothetical protein
MMFETYHDFVLIPFVISRAPHVDRRRHKSAWRVWKGEQDQKCVRSSRYTRRWRGEEQHALANRKKEGYQK